SVGDVFKLLKLDETGESLFKNPLLNSWVKYSVKFDKNGDEMMFLTLKKYFDEETLTKLIIAGKNDNQIAVKLEKVELENWLSSGKTSDEVFKHLNLNDDTANIFKNPAFNTWVSYVAMVDKETPYETMLAKLLAGQTDQSLAKWMRSPDLSYNTHKITQKLELVQLKNWLNSKKSSDDVFKLLLLHEEEGINLLKNSALPVWESYVRMLKKNPDEILLNELKMRNTDSEVAKLLVVAKQDYSIATARRLEEVMQNKWINEGKSAADVFNILKLEKEGNLVFDSPIWRTWSSYVTRLVKEDPEEPMYLVLKAQYGEKHLKGMIEKAKQNSGTKAIADKMQEESWLIEGKTADDIFKLLKLDEKGDKFFESPMLRTWLSYVTKLGKREEKLNEYATIVYLEDRFGSQDLARILNPTTPQTKEIVIKLRQLQFNQWMAEHMDPKVVGRMLSRKLDLATQVRVNLAFFDFYTTHGGPPFY
ncbi:hypothetical protein PHMEG_00024149, partial [Phytophthora megakarya]